MESIGSSVNIIRQRLGPYST